MATTPMIIGFAGFYDRWPGLTFLPTNFDLFYAPLIYLHAYALMQSKPLGWRWWTLAPAAGVFGYYVWAFWFLGNWEAKWAFNNALHEPVLVPLIFAGMLLASALCFLGVWKLLTQYQQYLAASQSATARFRPVWLHHLMIALVVIATFFFSIRLYSNFVERLPYSIGFEADVVVMAVLIWVGWSAVFSLRQPFPKMQAQEEPQTATGKDWQAEGERLAQRVVEERLFLKPELSVDDLARHLATNASYVSRAINQGLATSFNAYINGLRVEEAKRLISESQQSITEISFAAGFNSKATFYRAFQSVTGMTPRQFKNSQIR